MRAPAAPAAPRSPTILRRALTKLRALYRELARPWSDDELAERYQAAFERGAGDLPAGEEPPERPIMLLATAIPRLISLAVAANVLHLIPLSAHDDSVVAEELVATIDATAAGSLHRCHLALQYDGESRGYDAHEWLPLAYEQAADWLEHATAAADPPPAIDHAQQAGRSPRSRSAPWTATHPACPRRSPTASRTSCSPACSPTPPPTPDRAANNQPVLPAQQPGEGLRRQEPGPR